MDNASLTPATLVRKGKYVVIDTHLDGDKCLWVKDFNGRQGADDGRDVYLAIVDGDQPHDLTNSEIQLCGQDSQGVPKVASTVTDFISAAGGLCKISVPAAFYQAAGDYQHAYLDIVDKAPSDEGGVSDNVKKVSTVNIGFTVVENGLMITSGQSELYLGTISDTIRRANVLFETMKNAMDADKDALTEFTELIKKNKVAVLPGDNHFTGDNRFDGNTSFSSLTANSASIGNLGGSVLDQIKSLITKYGTNEARVNQLISQALAGIKGGGDDGGNKPYWTDAGVLTGINGFSTSGFNIDAFHLASNAIIYNAQGEFTNMPSLGDYSDFTECLQTPDGVLNGNCATLTNQFYAVNNNRAFWIKFTGNNRWSLKTQGGGAGGESEGGISLTWISVW